MPTSSLRPSSLSTVCLSPPLSNKRRGTVLLGKRRDRKRIDTIVSEREGEEGREGIEFCPTKILYTHTYIYIFLVVVHDADIHN